MKKTITLLLLFISIAFSCERDDICDENTATTPSMIIEFRDVTMPENKKNVLRLRIEDFDDATRTLTGFNETRESEIILPLKTTTNDSGVGETKYTIYKGYRLLENGTIQGNPDVITIRYETEELYVSRACGFKTVFNNITVTIEPDTNNWMLLALAENDNQTVINENETHFTIRH